MPFPRAVVSISALSGFLAVGLGAFGAHALHDLLEIGGRVATWETAVLYHLTHSVAALALGLASRFAAAAWLFLSGNLIFAGSLYLLCLTGISWLGAITPIGGVAFLLGWATIGIGAIRAS